MENIANSKTYQYKQWVCILMVFVLLLVNLPIKTAKAQTTQAIEINLRSCAKRMYYDLTSTIPEVYFYFDVTQEQIDYPPLWPLTITMNSIRKVDEPDNLDPYLKLLDRNRNLVAENDDKSHGTLNSELVVQLRQPGRYYVLASRYAGVGQFSLSAGFKVCITAGSGISPCGEEPIYGTLPNHSSEDYAAYYGIYGLAGKVYQITVRRVSENLLPYLELYEPEDSPNSTFYYSATAGQGRTDALRVTLRYDGLHQIKIFGFNGTTGRYILTCKPM